MALLSYLFPVFILISGSFCEYVPVLMWETTQSEEIIPALEHTTEETFKEILLQKIEKTNPTILVFAEQSLSPEDFVEEDKVKYEYLSNVARTSHVTYITHVDNSVDAIKALPSNSLLEISITDILKVNTLPKSKVVIINLNDAKDNEDRFDMLKRHDELIKVLYEKFDKQDEKVLAIYTGFHSSWFVPEEVALVRQARAVNTSADADDGTASHASGDNFLIYISNKGKYGDTEFTFKGATVTPTNSSDENVVYEIRTKENVIISMEIVNQSGYWYLGKLEVEGKKFNIGNIIYAPRGFSYHCSNANFSNDAETYLYLPELQFQYGSNKAFGDAYDCVGFTSAPIWSGLFITLILALIMTLGLSMMMDIKTMDRFDDPKGKTIIINASE